MPEDQDAEALTLRGAGAPDEHVQRRTQDGIAILTIAGPDGNRLSPALVKALGRALETAWSDAGVRAVVLTARGPDFCAGPFADLPPPGPEPAEAPPVMAALAALCRRIAHGPRPVVCALHGRVASGGLALALAARARLADRRAQLHFPEPRLARLPPGNGAVRLAWRVGAAAALALLDSDRPVDAAQAEDMGLVDRIEEERLVPAAIAAALALASGGDGGDPVPGLADGAGFRAAIVRARAALPDPLPGHRQNERQIIDVIEAAQLLPGDQALDFDLVTAQDAATAPAARSLAHLARAARRVLDTPEARATGPLPAHRAGPRMITLPPGEAALLVPPVLRAGHRVTLAAPDTDALTAALEAVAEAQLSAVAAGRLTQDAADADWERLEGRLAPDPQTPPELAIASPDRAAALDAVLDPGCPLLVWNQRGAPPARLAHPERVLGLVPGPVRSRAGLARLVEVVVPARARPEAVVAAMDFLLDLRLTPLRAAGGPVLPAMLAAAARAAAVLRAAGVAADAIRDCGLLPPAALLPASTDDTDTDTGAREATTLPFAPGRLILLALINTGAALLERGQALRPCDIDVAMVVGAGYPNWRGGPMAEGDGLGPLVLRRDLTLAAPLAPDLWSPAPLIDELVRRGWRFEDLNGG